MNQKTTTALVITALVLGIIGIFTPAGVQKVVEKTLDTVGAAAGPEYLGLQIFKGNAVIGGGIRATSTVNAAETLLNTDIGTAQGQLYKVIDYTLNVQAATLTLPASSTLSYLARGAGETFTIFIRNATTTATNLTIAGGTGTTLKKATTSAVIYGDTDGDNYGRLDFVRQTDTDFVVNFSTVTD